MSLASLMGTTWQIKSGYSENTFPYTSTFYSYSATYINMKIERYSDNYIGFAYYGNALSLITEQRSVVVTSLTGDIIKITSGADVDNSDLIAWFEANATQLNTTTSEEVEIRYKGNTINSLNEDSLLYLQTAGKFVEDNIRVRYRRPYLGEVSQEDGLVYLSEDGNIKVTADESDVNFIDYDGTILYSYSKEEFANLSALPANPYHQGLTAQGWNWSLSDAKTYVNKYGALCIGQMYITDDGHTRLYVELETSYLKPYLGLGIDGQVTIDWGDGTTADTVTGSDEDTVVYTQHNYSTPGSYMIDISVDNGSIKIRGVQDDSANGPLPFTASTTAGAPQRRGYPSKIKKIEIGENVTLGPYAFYMCSEVKSITIPQNTDVYGYYALYSFMLMEGLVIPSGATMNGDSIIGFEMSLKQLSIPKQVTIQTKWAYTNPLVHLYCLPQGLETIPSNCFGYNYIAKKIIIPDSVTTIAEKAFYCAYGMYQIDIPASVTSIGSQAFYNAWNTGEIRFNSATPPTLGGSDSFYYLPENCILYVPFDSFISYCYGTNYPFLGNWSNNQCNYIGYKTYANNVDLPTEGQQYFSGTYYDFSYITWYATKQDAINKTNPITKGNGQEVYARIGWIDEQF